MKDRILKQADKQIRKELGKLEKKAPKRWGRMMKHVLHPHGIPILRHLWTTKEQRMEHDKGIK